MENHDAATPSRRRHLAVGSGSEFNTIDNDIGGAVPFAPQSAFQQAQVPGAGVFVGYGGYAGVGASADPDPAEDDDGDDDGGGGGWFL